MDKSEEQSKTVSEVYTSLCERAKKSRNEGVVYVITIIGIAYSIVMYFVYAAQSAGFQISVAGSIAPVSISTGDSQWIPLVSGLVLRLGAVVLAVFVIQILVSLARYRFRISDSLYTKAEVIRLSNGNPEALKVLLPSFSDSSIDFGALPDSPYIEFAKVVRDIVTKGASK